MGEFYTPSREFRFTEFALMTLITFLGGSVISIPYVLVQDTVRLRDSTDVVFGLLFFVLFMGIALNVVCKSLKINSPITAVSAVVVGTILYFYFKTALMVSVSLTGGITSLTAQVIADPSLFLSKLYDAAYECSTIVTRTRNSYKPHYHDIGAGSIFVCWFIEAASVFASSVGFTLKRSKMPFSESEKRWLKPVERVYRFNFDDLAMIRNDIIQNPYSIMDFDECNDNMKPHCVVQLYENENMSECYATFSNVRYTRSRRRGYNEKRIPIVKYLRVDGSFCEAVKNNWKKNYSDEELNLSGSSVNIARVPSGINLNDIPDEFKAYTVREKKKLVVDEALTDDSGEMPEINLTSFNQNNGGNENIVNDVEKN